MTEAGTETPQVLISKPATVVALASMSATTINAPAPAVNASAASVIVAPAPAADRRLREPAFQPQARPR